jgi:type II secretory pathway pseudopilin PulG
MKTTIRKVFGRRSRQGGFTLFELIGVMALIGIATFAIMRAKRGAEVTTNAQALYNSVAAVQNEAPKVYPGVFTGLTCATLANNSVFSSTSFRVDRTNPATPTVFYSAEPNSQITCAPASVVVAGQNDGYTLTFPALSNEMCNAVSDKLNTSAWLMTVNGTPVKALRQALNTDTKGAQCNAAATNDNQTIVATFTRSLPPQ